MSRSYKKVGGFIDHNRHTWKIKRVASQRTRRKEMELVNGNMYKKVFESWLLCDYRDLEPTTKWCSLQQLISSRRK